MKRLRLILGVLTLVLAVTTVFSTVYAATNPRLDNTGLNSPGVFSIPTVPPGGSRCGDYDDVAEGLRAALRFKLIGFNPGTWTLTQRVMNTTRTQMYMAVQRQTGFSATENLSFDFNFVAFEEVSGANPNLLRRTTAGSVLLTPVIGWTNLPQYTIWQLGISNGVLCTRLEARFDCVNNTVSNIFPGTWSATTCTNHAWVQP